MKRAQKGVGGVENSIRGEFIEAEDVQNRIFVIRGQKVMLDIDLAILYGVSTKALNQAVKRNIIRFPSDFMITLNSIERDYVVTNCDHLKKLKYSYTLPKAFNEQGIAMLSSVLNSQRAALVNIAIMRAFVKLRRMISRNKVLEQKLYELEHKIERHDDDIIAILKAIKQIMKEEEKPKYKIGFLRDRE